MDIHTTRIQKTNTFVGIAFSSHQPVFNNHQIIGYIAYKNISFLNDY